MVFANSTPALVGVATPSVREAGALPTAKRITSKLNPVTNNFRAALAPRVGQYTGEELGVRLAEVLRRKDACLGKALRIGEAQPSNKADERQVSLP